MTRLPRPSGRDLLAALLRAGWRVGRVHGSHYILKRPDGSGRVVVPVHGSGALKAGTVGSILQQAGWTEEDLRGWL